MKKIIVIFGNIGSGKTTLTNIFAENYGTKILNFADPLKNAASKILGIPLSILYGSQKEKDETIVYGRSARYWLQWLGTDICKDRIDVNIWIDRLIESVRSSNKTHFIIGDGRFPNEELVELKKRLNNDIEVIGIKIKRSGLNYDLSHASERAVAESPDHIYDFIIYNEHSLEDFKRIANEIWEEINCVVE